MVENKLIVVDIADNESIILDGLQKIKSISGMGKLLVKNSSQKSKLWNLVCDLKEIVNTTVGSKGLNVGALNPGAQFEKDYNIQNLKEAKLKLVEEFDTNEEISDIVNNTFLYDTDNKCKLKLTLQNPLNLPIIDITLRRELPNLFQSIELKKPDNGSAEVVEEDNGRFLIWKIESLDEKKSAQLELECLANVKERKDQALGALKINYLINGLKLTMFNPSIRGLTDSMSGVSRDEGSSPGTWDCNVEFVNDSDFEVKLESVKVAHKAKTSKENVVSQTPLSNLAPNASWNFPFKIESQNVPDLSSEIEFTPLFEVIPRIIGEITKESTVYPVLSADISKTITPLEVDAYANTNMSITDRANNLGTAKIDVIEVQDEIPVDFLPPLIKQIKIELKNVSSVSDISSRLEYIQEIVLDPDDQNPDSKHVLKVSLRNLEKLMFTNAQLEITYPILAKNPKPGVKYNTPVELKVNVFVKGKNLVLIPPQEPEIKIKYVQRKFKTLKSIKPGTAEGDFNITVRIQNAGDVELENIVVNDKIPKGFKLTDFNPKTIAYNVVQVGGESDLEVKIAELKANESVNINYSCSGSGEYPRAEPQVTVKGRGESSAPKVLAGKAPATEGATEGAKMGFSHAKQAETLDIFTNIFKNIDKGVTALQLSKVLENVRDSLPMGPVLNQFMHFIRDMKTLGDKAVTGSLRDDVVKRIKEFKSKYNL